MDLALNEKIALVSGTDFMYTNSVSAKGIPSLRMSDGPHGLRVQTQGGDNGVTASLPATAFPTAATVASGWNPENSYKIGKAIGKEAHRYGVHMVLGPGANIKRNPTAGRNFEYFSEDPLLAGKLAAAEVKGIQSEGVGASLKHFALNNAEKFRFMGNSVADMRAMREIYLRVFEIAVKEAHPATVMCAYNKINGEYCSQNKWLLTDVLRTEWGFEGAVITDWGAMHDRVTSLKAGLDIEMPGDTAICRKWIVDGFKSGELSEKDLDKAVDNVLALVKKYAIDYPDDCDFDESDRIACEVATDCAVLMKNDGVLPLDKKERIFVCGDMFEKMRYQGAGSSMINPTKLTTPKDAFDKSGIKYAFARGYAENSIKTDKKYIDEAVTTSKDYDSVLVFTGLTDYVESEGCDREDMKLPENQLALIDALIKAGKKVSVVLFCGSPVELPFADDVAAILCMYLPGQSGGKACADLLFGNANPSGKLAETWPLVYGDVPFFNEFSKTAQEVYKESVFVGYRYYTSAKKQVRYPFGYGLSYTRFETSGTTLKEDGDGFTVTCEVANTGDRDGAEVVQLYVKAPESKVFKPEAELRAFKKVYLKAGEKAKVELEVRKDDLRYFDIKENDWVTEGGEYAFRLCSDANTVIDEKKAVIKKSENLAPYDDEVFKVYDKASFGGLTNATFEKMSGLKVPAIPSKKPITMESRFSDLAEAGFMGRILYKAVLGVADKQMKDALKMPEGKERDNKMKGAFFLRNILESNSLASMTMCAGKSCPYNFAEGFMHLANGRLIKGIKCFCTKIKVPALPKDKEEKR